MKANTNPLAPHRAIIWIAAEVQELLPTGECSGREAYTIRKFPVAIDGVDLPITIRKLNELLGEVKTKCRPTE